MVSAGDQPHESTIADWIRTSVIQSGVPLSPTTLTRRTVRFFSVSRRTVKSLMKELVDAGELEYIQRLGHTFLDVSFQKPVRVSPRVVLVPPEISFDGDPADIVVRLQRGVSFGAGSHPTTRLCLRSMDELFLSEVVGSGPEALRILDIGTGTGVLLVAGLRMGCEGGVGLDIDACARVETEDNLRINGLFHRAQVSGVPLEQVRGRFHLITANLRPPTLNRIRHILAPVAGVGTHLILSGFREEEEMRQVRQAYLDSGWRLKSEAVEKGWGALVMTR